ncbi:MAG: ankyrin repeat domain-containing protein [Synergistaceae bacterium]|nr:ankyrin repeat domain-containing protein [Synergistaceae bacterium]
MGKKHLTFLEILLEGIKKFAGGIIGGLLMALFLWFFPNLRSMFTEYKLPQESTPEIHSEHESQNQKEAGQIHVSQEQKQPAVITKTQNSAISDMEFMKLCRIGNADDVKKAIMNGANVNAKDSDNMTILMFAVAEGRIDMAKLLLQNGADVNATNDDGMTALIGAATLGYTEIAELLLQNGAHANAKDEDGMTALMFAASEGHKDTAKLLLQNGADVNAKDNDNWTALMFTEDWDIAQLLRSYGAEMPTE